MTRPGRFTLAILAGTLAVLFGSMIVVAGESNIADSFPKAGSYSGDTGLQTWSGPWVEETESDGASAGNISVVQSGFCIQGSNCLRFVHSGDAGTQAIRRNADLTGAEGAILQFSLSRQGPSAANVTVQAVGNGTESRSYPVNSDTPTVHTLDISDVVGGATQIRFEIFGVGDSKDLFVDNARIDLVYPDATTTTTTTLAPSTTTTLAASTTTSAPPSNSTTTRPTTTTTRRSSTTTVDESGTTTTVPPSQSGSDQTPPHPATGLELDVARLSGVTLNMAAEAPAELGFRFGVNPVTGLTVNFSSVVEVIKAEFLSALGLGTMVAFFAVGGWKREDEEDGDDEGPLSRS